MACRMTPVLLAWLVACLAHGPALASPVLTPTLSAATSGQGPTVTVVYVGLDAKAKAQAGVFERAVELGAHGRFTWVPVGNAVSPQAAATADARRDAARASLKAGQEALDSLDNAKAGEAFAAALSAGQEVDHSQYISLMFDALTRKAANHALGGELAAAKQDLDRLLAMNPKAELNPGLFSPDLQKYAESRRKQFAASGSPMVVRSEPPGANVWVNGQYRGLAPVTVSGLAPGKHSVVVALGGFGRFQTEFEPGEHLVTLKAGELSGAYRKAVDAVAADPQGPGRDVALVGLGRALKVDQLIALVARKSTAGEKVEVTALRIEMADGHNSAFAQQTLAVDPSSANTVASLLFEKEVTREGKKPTTHFARAQGTDGKLIAGVVMLGAAVVAAGVGTGLGFVANGKHAQFRNTPQIDTVTSRELTVSGRQFALGADLAFLGAAILGVTGTTLTILGAIDSGPSAPPVVAMPPPRAKAASPVKRQEEAPPPKVDKRADDERRRLEEERIAAEEAKARAKQAEEAKRSDEEKKRLDDAKRSAEEAKRLEEEKKRAAIDEAKEAKRLEEEKKRAAADEAKRRKKLSPADRKREEERLKAEDEARKLEAADDEFQRMAEERKKRDAERKKQLEDEQKRQEEDLRGK
jgi:hypothetical protein